MTRLQTTLVPGSRVQLHPATDRWVRGDRYGTVETIGRRYIAVRMDVSSQLVRYTPDLLTEV